MFIKPQTPWSLHPRLVTCDRLPGVSTAVQRRMDQQDKWDTAVQHYQRLLYRLPFGALKVRPPGLPWHTVPGHICVCNGHPCSKAHLVAHARVIRWRG